jgi:aryl-phospho-beta-D-glucosidase BglC (GH1 family)
MIKFENNQSQDYLQKTKQKETQCLEFVIYFVEHWKFPHRVFQVQASHKLFYNKNSTFVDVFERETYWCFWTSLELTKWNEIKSNELNYLSGKLYKFA